MNDLCSYEFYARTNYLYITVPNVYSSYVHHDV